MSIYFIVMYSNFNYPFIHFVLMCLIILNLSHLIFIDSDLILYDFLPDCRFTFLSQLLLLIHVIVEVLNGIFYLKIQIIVHLFICQSVSFKLKLDFFMLFFPHFLFVIKYYFIRFLF